MARVGQSWLTLGFDIWALGWEATSVMALRSAKLAEGGARAQSEAMRMVAEKVEAAAGLGMLAATGGLGADPVSAGSRTLKHYRRKVRANRRRLARG